MAETSCPPDAEIEALRIAYAALSQMDAGGKTRALAWLTDKLRREIIDEENKD